MAIPVINMGRQISLGIGESVVIMIKSYKVWWNGSISMSEHEASMKL
jgi:hypothetical protein